MADEKKLDFGKLNVRKKNKTTAPKPQKIYKEVEQLPKEQPRVEKQEVKPEEQQEHVERLELASEPTPVTPVTPVIPKKKSAPKKKATKVGRKSWKKEGVTYTRLAFDTPIETKQKIKQLLATKFFGKFISQDEMINHAMDEFIKKHGLK